jgi:exosome complex component RRP40
MDPEITCESKVGKKDWVTGECTFGDIQGGYVCKVSLLLAQRLLDGRGPVLEIIGHSIPYELAIGDHTSHTTPCSPLAGTSHSPFLSRVPGANGRVWIKAESSKNTVAIANAIINSEFLAENEVVHMVNALLAKLGE